MSLTLFLTYVALLVISGVMISIIAYYLIKDDIRRFFNLKSIELKQGSNARMLDLRLQAHERLILFIERINPANMLVRLHQKGINVRELHSIVLNDVRTEYQYNITQQLYVSAVTWHVIKKLKEDTIAMINNAADGLPDDLSAVELSKKVLQHMASMERDPYEITLELIKKDIHQLF